MLSKWAVTLVAIGNGTGNREASALVVDALTSEGLDSTAAAPAKYLIVDESGASVYSASKLAVSELPAMDVDEDVRPLRGSTTPSAQPPPPSPNI